MTHLVDGHGRSIRYLRISLTDRCNFRCTYCMAETMQFMPAKELLSLDEVAAIAQAFTLRGVQRIRLTGGEPLIRPGVVDLVQRLRGLPGISELTLSTNGALLSDLARPLRKAGLNRLNISLDTLRADRFRTLTRTGNLRDVLAGIEAARSAGFDRLRLNAVILRGQNDDEVLDLLAFARDQQLDLAFIEEMPLGVIDGHDRARCMVPAAEILRTLQTRHALHPVDERSSGPARYHRMPDSLIRVGFIAPHSQNFCGDCNRLRLTATGRLLTCLGHEDGVDLRQIVRGLGSANKSAQEALQQAIEGAVARKPAGHDFDLAQPVRVMRFMSVTGG